jgi:mannose-1-phosphate guanylyltransferase/mannose-6-phosphate isomerase
MLIPVILSGGTGSRLWPLSREGFPKQFLSLESHGFSLLQSTLQRLGGLTMASPLLVCNQEHRFLVAEQVRDLKLDTTILLEPFGRNTAPALAVAALQAQQHAGEEALLLVLPADHVIQDVKAFHAAVHQGTSHAQQGALVTFGIVPAAPETGYGYIKAGQDLGTAYTVDAFVEKPDVSTAQHYLAAGSYYWNSGMFLLRADRYLEELERHSPMILQACRQALADASTDLDFVRIDSEAFGLCPSDSIDYAVMEKTEQAVVVPLAADWSDVGAWSSLWEVSEKDEEGNVLTGDVLQVASRNCYLRSEHRLVAALGVEDLVVVETPDAILIAHQDKVQHVKQIVQDLNRSGRSEGQLHRQVYRPWGAYDSIDAGERFQVKRITVKPGASLSLQRHFNRAEHWIVVKGSARVTVDQSVTLLAENESIYIPLGAVHRLENPGKIPLELIEVQSGSYLGEDDIERLSDAYGRVPSTSIVGQTIK